mmetsp:Transcript_12383/g.57285  ORF Transcript_12383/g.57285 Transcript_12383/m.57285 type:complete len:223 (+) Transcript_12383:2489-3157(+)
MPPRGFNGASRPMPDPPRSGLGPPRMGADETAGAMNCPELSSSLRSSSSPNTVFLTPLLMPTVDVRCAALFRSASSLVPPTSPGSGSSSESRSVSRFLSFFLLFNFSTSAAMASASGSAVVGADAAGAPFLGLALASSASRSSCTSSMSGAELLGRSASRVGTRFLSTFDGPDGLAGESSSSSMNILALGTGFGPSDVNTVDGLRGDFAPVKPPPPPPERLP